MALQSLSGLDLNQHRFIPDKNEIVAFSTECDICLFNLNLTARLLESDIYYILSLYTYHSSRDIVNDIRINDSLLQYFLSR